MAGNARSPSPAQIVSWICSINKLDRISGFVSLLLAVKTVALQISVLSTNFPHQWWLLCPHFWCVDDTFRYSIGQAKSVSKHPRSSHATELIESYCDLC